MSINPRAAACCVLLLAVCAVRASADPLYALEHIGRSDGLTQPSGRYVQCRELYAA